MKKMSLICIAVLACISLSACGKNSTEAKESSEASSLKLANSKLKKKVSKKKHSGKKQQLSSSAASSSARQNNADQNQVSNSQKSASKGVNNADDAVAIAKAKYGDNGGAIHWGYMIDGETGQPIRNSDGSYFVKGTTNNGTMTGTQYSINVYPDGSTTSN